MTYGWHEAGGRKVFGVRRIALHRHVDLDADFALFLVRLFPQVFPGAEKAPIMFWAQGPPEDGRSAADHEAEGTLMLDVGGEEATFDHHPHGKCLTECTSDLVAEFIGITDSPIFRPLLEYVRVHDLRGPTSFSRKLRKMAGGLNSRLSLVVSAWSQETGLSFTEEATTSLVQKLASDLQPELETYGSLAALFQKFSLASLMSVLRRLSSDDLNLSAEALRLLGGIYERDRYFWTEIRQEFLANAQIAKISDGECEYRVAVIVSPHREVGSFSRTAEGGHCSLCIQRNPKTGHTFLSGTISAEQKREIGGVARVVEMALRGLNVPYTFAELQAIGRFESCPQWYMPTDDEGEPYIVMNGGDKATTVEPSMIPLTQLLQVGYTVLDTRVFAPECPRSYCLEGTCSFYRFGLSRCQAIREPAAAVAAA